MTREWAHEMAAMLDNTIVITNGEIYKTVSPEVFEIAGYKSNGWRIDVLESEVKKAS